MLALAVLCHCFLHQSSISASAPTQNVVELCNSSDKHIFREHCSVVVCGTCFSDQRDTNSNSQEFLRRSEDAFRALHERVLYLEQRQAGQGPTDEQVERVLRKILAERFADGGAQRSESLENARDGQYFVKPPDNTSIPRAPNINGKLLLVDADAVPSKAYGQTFKMLQKGLSEYPQVDLTKSYQKSDSPENEETFKQSQSPHEHARPW